jgi:hypothetical protein
MTLLVDDHSALSLAQQFGSGWLASVDGLRFVVPVKTINAAPNPRYRCARRRMRGAPVRASAMAVVLSGRVRRVSSSSMRFPS